MDKRNVFTDLHGAFIKEDDIKNIKFELTGIEEKDIIILGGDIINENNK